MNSNIINVIHGSAFNEIQNFIFTYLPGVKETKPYKLYIINDAMIRMLCILIGGFGVQS